jgi:hypothetical protein
MTNKIITLPDGRKFHKLQIQVGGCTIGWSGSRFEHIAINGNGYFSYGTVDARTVFGAMKKHGLINEYKNIKSLK